ncbi:ribonuclease J [Liquorilactobacillus satsumensis]|uniref:Ribonuclease J n=1 Tax=Liquorilactobacillus satsumensis DSM 16230 = JCM 12392 TaxID=1423801 RepID=A0A0R1V2V1_9LACO|nr:ribonuclease J [Liquorilactobacillus satsumensis]KRL99961.1 metallo-beta-lactamase superfamily protein [Liquorilactobacillus satsumensis DSM 16230 = JCM 12392]MCC7665546.1 ribonuclease J [Liquorilactobacillus satsumensis]MCP9311759.1 ribonuclease J [Liquorilactobacillus satsumensis]MCP9328441.1 ribonuclease J [Liquorilactobacillus satsumensis]MCP9357303.1 ribonuclease J [Liquorilactobacillus satsumensis]
MSNIKIIPLGGVRENAKNMYAVEANDEIFILDCGLKYPENGLFGIDTVIPDFSYLRDNAQKIVGVFLTHGHADAIGALPYFLSEFKVPVFGTELTIALAKIGIKNNPQTAKFADFHVINEQTEIDFENATVSFFRTTHSIPDSVGIVVKTKKGSIVYTGDFKFDQTATNGYRTNLARLAEIGKDGVLALLSDSANAENPTETVAEHEIFEFINDNFEYRNGRIVVACVASNIMRVQQVFDAAAKNGRKVVLTGHDAEEIVNTALNLDKLHLPVDDLLVAAEKLDSLEDDQVVILETGRSGEPLKALQKMALKKHRTISLHEGDLVFITTTPSHAMETEVARTRDMIYRAGADVKAISEELNSSGHASRNDLQLMMNLLQPDYVIPIQGEYRLLSANARCALEIGIPKDHIFMVSKGDIIEYDHDKLLLASSVEVGDTLIDGSGVGDIGNIVLRDRKILSEDGVFIAVVTIDRRKKKIVNQPQITSRGFVYVKTSRDLITESATIVTEAVQKNLDNKEFDWGHLKQDVREQLNHFLYEHTKRHPVILPVIMEINQHRHFNRKKKSTEE